MPVINLRSNYFTRRKNCRRQIQVSISSVEIACTDISTLPCKFADIPSGFEIDDSQLFTPGPFGFPRCAAPGLQSGTAHANQSGHDFQYLPFSKNRPIPPILLLPRHIFFSDSGTFFATFTTQVDKRHNVQSSADRLVRPTKCAFAINAPTYCINAARFTGALDKLACHCHVDILPGARGPSAADTAVA